MPVRRARAATHRSDDDDNNNHNNSPIRMIFPEKPRFGSFVAGWGIFDACVFILYPFVRDRRRLTPMLFAVNDRYTRGVPFYLGSAKEVHTTR